MKRLLGCNPFYLASAALLLYGVYRVSMDDGMFGTEIRQLGFNFGALQIYELVLVVTATFLVTRRIWYDSSLLVALENMLWIVPFILVSQAAFITPKLALYLCLMAIFLAAARTGWLRIRAREILPSAGTLWCAVPLLLVNAAWPVMYRHFGESKVGINIESGAAHDFNELSWFWLLPILAGMLLILPRPAIASKPFQMRQWFPLLLFGFWLVGTGVHLYSLDYVYDFKLRREQLAPVFWVLAWGTNLRLAHFIKLESAVLKQSLLFLPLLAMGPAALVAESRVFFILSALNLLAYATVVVLDRERRWVLQLGLISFATTIVSLPIDFAPLFARPISQSNLLGMAMLGYAVIGSLGSRNPKAALMGAIAAMTVGGLVRQTSPDWFHWGFQIGCGYLILHSLRWRDWEHAGAALMRYAVLLGWLLHSFFWSRPGGGLGMMLSLAAGLTSFWVIRGFVLGDWDRWAIPLTAALVALCHPVHWMVVQMQAAPVGLLYVLGSFLLFGAGTAAALNKHRWHKQPPA